MDIPTTMESGFLVVLGLGSNLPSKWGTSQETIERAIAELQHRGVTIDKVASIIETEPIGPPGQPRYSNTVALAHVSISPFALLKLLKRLEVEGGREHGDRWGPRTIDIDIISYDDLVMGWDKAHNHLEPSILVLPHPEMHNRRFVLEPLVEMAPGWRHPVLGKTARELLEALP
jgi:2-amino-4-hydroxy-6-hydroxymethyldihydropteridine diphosphokinase